MTRRELREHCFKMLFSVDFYTTGEEAKAQMQQYFQSPEEDDTAEDGSLQVVHKVAAGEKDREYLSTRTADVVDKIEEIDAKIDEVAAGWKTKRMGKVELTILRLAVYEMLYDDTIPEKVSVNEAVELAKKFGGNESPAFVNGVLAKFIPKEEKKEEPQEIIPAKDEALLAPVSGKVIPLSEVRDEAFAGGILGQGAAVIPENGEICAPCDGVISVMYPTGHAVGIKSDIGAEILIHVGMDTVTLNGSCFAVKVKAGDYVKAGQLLVRANIEGIKKEGLDITTPVIVANTADYMQIKTVAEESVKSGEVLLNCVSK